MSGRVLVVDDSKVIRQLIRVNLELEGFEVVTAADGAECLEMVRHVRPDVVTLDVVMPRLDGLRTAARLRADPLTRDLPIAIVSACSQFDLERGEAAGIDAYLAKPFEPVELVRLVRQLMHAGTEDGGADGGPGGPRATDPAETKNPAAGTPVSTDPSAEAPADTPASPPAPADTPASPPPPAEALPDTPATTPPAPGPRPSSG